MNDKRMHSMNLIRRLIMITGTMLLLLVHFAPARTYAAPWTLTYQEQEWLREKQYLRVGYVDDYMPFCGTGKDGRVTGAVSDLFGQIVKSWGEENQIPIFYVRYDSFRDMNKALYDRQIDLAFPIIGESSYLREMEISGSAEVINVPMYVAYLGNYSEETFDVIALNSRPIRQIQTNYPDSQILNVDSAKGCYDAILDGRATCTVMASYRMKEILNDPKYRKINSMPFGVSMPYCIGVAKYENRLRIIINKGIQSMDDAVLADSMYRYIQSGAKYTITDFIRDNSAMALLIAVFVVGILTFIFWIYLRSIRREQRRTAAALEAARAASNAKSDFLSRMSHDIRTPLNGIIGLLEISEKHKDDAALVAANRKKEMIAANHLLSLINDVLDMSKLESGNIELANEPFNIYSVCEEVLTICAVRARENGIKPVHDGGVNLIYPNVYGSPLHLKQIMMNLINNGIKYNKPGGTIFTRVELVSFNGETVVYRFIARDTGIGISREYLEHIYEPFTQEKQDARSRYQGTGMGMAIVKALVDRMHGSIEVESEVGVGSTFSVTIPFKVNKDVKPDAEREVSRENYSIEGMRLLLVEDNELNMEIAQIILEDAGANVETAVNGQIACEIFESCEAGRFDAILMDIMMPELDGYAATRRIRSGHKADAGTIPIIAMTANAFSEDVQKAKDAGMNDHLAKPLEIDKLILTLARYYEGAGKK